MPRRDVTVLALRTIANATSSPYVCQACLSSVRSRALHSSSRRPAETPFWKRLSNTIFGTQEQAAANVQREKRAQELPKPTRNDQYIEGDDSLVQGEHVVKGKIYTVAQPVDAKTNPEYKQAFSTKGLPRIGGAKWVKERADTAPSYSRCVQIELEAVAQAWWLTEGSNVLDKKLSLSQDEWKLLLRHILVEVFTTRKRSIPIAEALNSRIDRSSAWLFTTRAVIVVNAKSGAVEVTFADPGQEEAFVATIRKGFQAAEVSDERVEAAERPEATEGTPRIAQKVKQKSKAKQVQLLLRGLAQNTKETVNYGESISWMQVSFADSEMKLAVLQRISQLTGQRLSDFTISSATTFQHLYESLKVKPPPKKLADTEIVKSLGEEIANVSVYDQRRSTLTKEIEVGRWKLIEKELLDRGLPLGVRPQALDKAVA